MKLTSPVIVDNGPIPELYTGTGADISPPLLWSDVPKDCKSLVLMCEDFNATLSGTNFTHWLLYNLSPNLNQIPQDLPLDAGLTKPIIADQGKNSFGKTGYRGPMPPMGSGVHHYYFTLYALKENLAIRPGASKHEVLAAMKGNIVATTTLSCTYERLASLTRDKKAA